MKDKATKSIELDLSKVNYDFTYQRPPMNHQQNIAATFNTAAVGCLLIGKRKDSSLWCIDGQQRIGAMLSLGIKRWVCEVVESTGAEFEAALYTIINGGTGTTKGLRQRDIFKAKVAAKDPVAQAVKATAESVGLRVPITGGHGWPDLGCHERLMRLAGRKSGILNLKTTLEVVVAAWPEDSRGLERVMLHAIQLAIEYGAEKKRLISRLQGITPLMIVQKAMSLGNRNSVHYHFHEIARRYNSNLKKNRLPDVLSE